MRSLIVIDDKRLRSEAFAEAARVLKKLDRLEANLEAFHDCDQRLFNDWFELTFREERQEIEELQKQFRDLGRFHNWMIAIAKQRDVSMPEAFRILREEEALFERGSAEEKRLIEEERRRREEFIRAEVERELGYESGEFEDEELGDFDEFGEEPPRNEEDEEELRFVAGMSDKKLRKVLRVREGAMELLSMVLGLGRKVEDYVLFFRIWDLTPHKFQVEFSRIFSSQSGMSLKTVMDAMREAIARGDVSGADMTDKSDPEVGSEGPDFDEAFIGMDRPRTSAAHSPEAVEEVKLIYRKLVRKLHPDLQEGGVQSYWQKKIWDRIQDAYRRLDRAGLEILQKLVWIRQRDLSELSLSEIRESRGWLQSELNRMESEIRDIKRSAPWGFSRRRTYEPLRKKFAKILAGERAEIAERVMELSSEHELLEFLANTMNTRQRPLRRKRRKQRKGTSGQNRSRTRSKTSRQTAFDI